ncbi:hypothetical protein LY78DRAFT_531462, partial [Colletotrichum sublineola]
PATMHSGHEAGARCLDKWFWDHKSCPFVVKKLVYGSLLHITVDGIPLIPTTISEGGAITELCY